jgi:hypothetical protein
MTSAGDVFTAWLIERAGTLHGIDLAGLIRSPSLVIDSERAAVLAR